jgi:hypothetical protein
VKRLPISYVIFEGLTKTVTHQAHITSNHLIEEINDTTAKAK